MVEKFKEFGECVGWLVSMGQNSYIDFLDHFINNAMLMMIQ